MASTSVKLTENGKGELDRLQARLTLLGRKLTKEQVLEFALRAVSRRPGDLIVEAEGGLLALSPEDAAREARRAVGRAEDWHPTSWREIDEAVYGGRRQR